MDIYICTYNLNGWKHFSERQCVLVCCSLKPFKASMIFVFPLQSCKILSRMTRKLECYDSFRHNRMHLLHTFLNSITRFFTRLFSIKLKMVLNQIHPKYLKSSLWKTNRLQNYLKHFWMEQKPGLLKNTDV